MKNSPKLILASSIADTGHLIGRELEKDPSKYKVLFVTTAAEVEEGGINAQWVENDKKGLLKVGFNIQNYTITDKKEEGLRKALDQTDILFVNGGNSFYLLQQIRKTGFDKLIIEFLEKGGIYGGSSAGTIIAGVDIEPSRVLEHEETTPDLKDSKGLALVNCIILAHWGSKHFKDLYMNRRLEKAYRDEFPVLLLTDKSYLVVDTSGKFKICG